MSGDTTTPALPFHEIAWLGSAQGSAQGSAHGSAQESAQPDRAVPTLVLLHGYGSNEKDLIALVPAISMFLPGISARVIAVRGSHPAPGRARGYSWFPGSVLLQPPIGAIADTADRVAEVIRRHTDRAVVLGFSQGMCTAITVLRRHPELVTGLVGLSGFMFDDDHPGDGRLALAAATGTGVPAFVGYDPADPVIPAMASRWALTYLRTHTALEEYSYPGMGHSVSMPEIGDLARFLRTHLT